MLLLLPRESAIFGLFVWVCFARIYMWYVLFGVCYIVIILFFQTRDFSLSLCVCIWIFVFVRVCFLSTLLFACHFAIVAVHIYHIYHRRCEREWGDLLVNDSTPGNNVLRFILTIFFSFALISGKGREWCRCCGFVIPCFAVRVRIWSNGSRMWSKMNSYTW